MNEPRNASALGPWFPALRDRVEWALRGVIYNAIWYALIHRRLYHGPEWMRRVASWALPYAGGWACSPRAYELNDRIKARTCEHDFRYDAEMHRRWTLAEQRVVLLEQALEATMGDALYLASLIPYHDKTRLQTTRRIYERAKDALKSGAADSQPGSDA